MKMLAKDEKTENRTWSEEFFLWRTKVSEAECKGDWNKARLYLFFNVRKCLTPCAMAFRLKGILHPKMKIRPLITYSMSFQTRKSFVRLRNIIYDMLDENREACDCPIYCIVNCTVKIHKSMKSIIIIVHLPSVVQSEFNDATRTLFLCRENKTTLFNNSSPQRSAILENILWTQTVYTLVCHPCSAADTKHTLLASSGYSLKWRYAEVEETNCRIKSLFGHGGKWLMTQFSFWGGVSL